MPVSAIRRSSATPASDRIGVPATTTSVTQPAMAGSPRTGSPRATYAGPVGGSSAGGATVRMDEKFFLSGFFTWTWNWSSRLGRLLAGSFIFVETAVFREIGGFNNELFAAEELDLSKRLKRLAREKGRGIVILHSHPLVTSARKMRLYTAGDHLKLLVHVIFNRRALTRRESCTLWYDGRR